MFVLGFIAGVICSYIAVGMYVTKMSERGYETVCSRHGKVSKESMPLRAYVASTIIWPNTVAKFIGLIYENRDSVG